MLEAICELKQLRLEQVPKLNRAGFFAALEAANLALTAELVAHAKLARKESRSAHQRRDFPAMDDSWVKHVCLSRQDDGEVQVKLIPVATSG